MAGAERGFGAAGLGRTVGGLPGGGGSGRISPGSDEGVPTGAGSIGVRLGRRGFGWPWNRRRNGEHAWSRLGRHGQRRFRFYAETWPSRRLSVSSPARV